MRITHVVCTDNFAGVERHIAGLAAAQHDLGHEVTVLGGRQGRMRSSIARDGVRVLPAPDRRTAARLLAGPAGRADVIATHMTDADVVALSSPRLVRTPIVSTRHFAAQRGATPAHRSLAERLQPRLAAEIAVSEFIAGTVDVDASVVLPGVADRPDGPPPSQRAPTVLLVQRLEAEKGTDVGLSAFAASGLSDEGWRLQVAGDGSQRLLLEEQAQDLGIAAATDFLGQRDDVEELMGRAALFLAPCEIEGVGLAVIEAMASGLPVVAAAAGGHLETVGRVEDAALFTPGDAEQAGRLLAELAHDPDRHDTYGTRVREQQRALFTPEAQARSTDEVYRHAIAPSTALAEPRLTPGRGLVVISLEPWDRVWRRNQHLLSGLLRQDPSLRVLVVEPGTDPVHDVRRGVRPRTGRGLRRGPHLPGVDPDALWLYEPTKVLPRRVDPGQDARWANTVRATARRLGLTHPALWVNDPRGAVVMERTSWPTLYDITDDWLEADRDAATLERLRRQEGALMDGAAEVVVCSSGLVAAKSRSRPVTLVHNAVDDLTVRPTARPADLPSGATATYVGTLHSDRLDISACVEAASALGGVGTVVLVGPDALTAHDRHRLDDAGVVRLGAKDRRLVPAYLQHSDVLLVPHIVDTFTDSLDPIKLYEYRAVGRPVVSTPVAGFREAADERLSVVESRDFADAVVRAVPAEDRFPTGADPTVPRWGDRVEEMRRIIDRLIVPATVSPSDRAHLPVPMNVRVRLGHAAVQHIATEHGVDILHIKGYGLDPRLTYPGRRSSDADVLVRPGHIPRLLRACRHAGYRTESRFPTGSPFEHSTTLWHHLWGHLDVHRHYPGVGLPADEAFHRLWTERMTTRIGGVECATPSLAAQVAILVMHAGRNPSEGQPQSDVEHAWRRADPDLQAEVRNWVEDFGAGVAFAAGTGELSTLPPSAEKDLWTAVTSPGRVHEWRARIAAAPTLRGRLALLLRAPLVNTDHLAHQLGRRPARADIARAFVNRLRQAAHEIHEMRSR